MLWKGLWMRRAAEAASPAPSPTPEMTGAAGIEGSPPADSSAMTLELSAAGSGPATPEAAPAAPRTPPWKPTRRRVLLGLGLVMVAGLGYGYTHKSDFSSQGADLSRRIIGDERTARLESWYFRLQDRIDRTKYRVLGGDTDPFAAPDVVVQFVARPPQQIIEVSLEHSYDFGPELPPPPKPMTPTDTIPLRDTLETGEGVWTTSSLPRTSPDDPVLMRTFVRPDKSRPYALVGVLLMDSRRVMLHMVGGTSDPGGDRGVKGPGVIPQDDRALLIAAWNGGFKGPHGGYGMIANGKEYRPLRNGLASIAVMQDGTIKMGEWGNDIAWEEGMVGVRQNAVLLVRNGEISKRVTEGNDTWGYVNVNSAEFITWRSAVGLTKDGNLLYASGNSLSAETLAKALWAAGAHTAMQLDINTPYVLGATYFPQPDGSLSALKFMDTMSDNPARFLKTQERDFMYITLDETRYRNPAPVTPK